MLATILRVLRFDHRGSETPRYIVPRATDSSPKPKYNVRVAASQLRYDQLSFQLSMLHK